MNRAQARQKAREYVASKLSFGGSRERMNETIAEGYAAPGQPGFELRHGRITVPGITRDEERHTFTTDDLADEIEKGQGDLFGSSA